MTSPTDPKRSPDPRSDRAQTAAGFTLIELLIVVATIGTLVFLLLPAIQSSREVARRVQCSKNLMQLGIALANYASSHRVFPPGVVNDRGPILNTPRGYHFGWAAFVLPFLEAESVYRNFNFHESVYAPSNETARSRRINIFSCPSDPIGGGLTSYAACHHDVEAPIDVDNHGVFYLNSRIGYDDLLDGPAFTILLGETRRSGPTWAAGTAATLRNTGSPINADPPLSQLPPAGAARSFQPGLGSLDEGIPSGIVPVDFVGGFLSHHPMGANFLLGDGSVRLIQQTVSNRVYRSLAHRADGNLISDDEF